MKTTLDGAVLSYTHPQRHPVRRLVPGQRGLHGGARPPRHRLHLGERRRRDVRQGARPRERDGVQEHPVREPGRRLEPRVVLRRGDGRRQERRHRPELQGRLPPRRQLLGRAVHRLRLLGRQHQQRRLRRRLAQRRELRRDRHDSTNFGSSVIELDRRGLEVQLRDAGGRERRVRGELRPDQLRRHHLTSADHCPDGYKPAKGKGCAEHLYFYPGADARLRRVGAGHVLDPRADPRRHHVGRARGRTRCGSRRRWSWRRTASTSPMRRTTSSADLHQPGTARPSPAPATRTTVPDGGDATQSPLDAPVGLALAADGTTLYIADRDANRIRKVDAVARRARASRSTRSGRSPATARGVRT